MIWIFTVLNINDAHEANKSLFINISYILFTDTFLNIQICNNHHLVLIFIAK